MYPLQLTSFYDRLEACSIRVYICKLVSVSVYPHIIYNMKVDRDSAPAPSLINTIQRNGTLNPLWCSSNSNLPSDTECKCSPR